MKASEAIERGELVSPPHLTEPMIAAHADVAAEVGAVIVPVALQSRYASSPDSPVLVIHGSCLFELLDNWDADQGRAQLAACKAGNWFRVVPEKGGTAADCGFLTWHYSGNAWCLLPLDQYLA